MEGVETPLPPVIQRDKKSQVLIGLITKVKGDTPQHILNYVFRRIHILEE